MNKYILGILPMLLLASCSKEADIKNIDSNKGVKITFTSGVNANMSLEIDKAKSRSIIENTYFSAGEQIGIYGIKSTASEMDLFDWKSTESIVMQEYLDNALYTAKAFTDGTQLLKQNETPKFSDEPGAALVFYAYYPYTTNVSYTAGSAPIIPVEIQSTVEATPDYMYTGKKPVAAGVAEKSVDVPLTFNHALGRLDFYIKTMVDNFTTTPILNKITVTTVEGQKGSMDISTGEITIDESPETTATKVFEDSPNTNITVTSTLASKFMFIPAVDAIQKIELALTNENGTPTEYTLYDKGTGAEAIKLVKGKTTKITINYTRTVNMTATVETWVDGENDKEIDIN